ncbi:hypothetical protein [Massilia sp.]|uniref:hypothetical protein n=1 Tax=Massilia sp. TaxID=1882437 RepID=UPI0028A12D76|nr:hypothetical protein [Massilia sp.]
MWIVAIAWMYVVVLMAATEPTVVGGIMTFLFYCALPLSLLFYISGARRRRVRQRGAAPQRNLERDVERNVDTRKDGTGGPDTIDADGDGD